MPRHDHAAACTHLHAAPSAPSRNRPAAQQLQVASSVRAAQGGAVLHTATHVHTLPACDRDVCRAARTASLALVDNAHSQQGGSIETVPRTAQPKSAPCARDALPRHSSGGTATPAYRGDMVPGKRRSRCSGAHLREQAARGRRAKAALQLGARDGVQLARRAGARVRPLLPRAKQLLRKGSHAVCAWRDAAHPGHHLLLPR